MNDWTEEERHLLMRALDRELGPAEEEAFERRLAEDPAFEADWRRLSRVREATMGFKLRNPPEEVWDGYWNSVYSRVERGIGWLLFSLGVIVVGSWAVWNWIAALLADTATPAPVRYGTIAIAVGLVILLVSVTRHRLSVLRTDPYKDIRR